MKKRQHDYQVVPFPKLRREFAVMYRSVQRKPMTHGLLEVDVTKARQYLRDHKAKTGESLSFTAFIAACLAQAIDENKSLHAYRKGRKRLVLFDEVDVATAVERNVAGLKQPIIYIIRAANKKTFREIHHDIRTAQVEEVEKAWTASRGLHWILFLPMVFFRVFWWVFCWMRRSIPRRRRSTAGRWA